MAERALKRIFFRREDEKLNVWSAYLNLEHRYGDEQTLAVVLRRALQHNDPRQVYVRVADLYRRAGQVAELEQLYVCVHVCMHVCVCVCTCVWVGGW